MVIPSKPPISGNPAGSRQPKETRRRHQKTANSVTSEENAKRRIVPEEFRKRTSVSCDLCKTRRVKCERSDGNDGPCKNCIKLNMPCQSALPRKKRIYGSVESLGERFRVLDEIVAKLLPQEDTSDTARLIEIANCLEPVKGDSLQHSALQHSQPLPIGRQRSSTQGSATVFQQPNSSLTNPATNIVTAGWSAPPTLYHSGSRSGEHSQLTSLGEKSDHNSYDERRQNAAGSSYATMKEKLYPNTQGLPSYLGPSSSFKFMIKIREMLASGGLDRNRVKAGIGTDAVANGGVGSAENDMLRREFSKDQSSKVIEVAAPDVGDQDDGEDQSTADGSSVRDGSSVAGSVATSYVTAGTRRFGTGPPMSVTAADDYNITAPAMPIPGPDLCESIRNSLPERETADALVDAFFDNVHPNYFVFQRPLFQHALEAFYEARSERDTRKIDDKDSSPATSDPAWACNICMVLAFGAQALIPKDRRRAQFLQQRYAKLAQTTFYLVISQTTMSSIQALLLVQLYQHNAGERNGAWILLGCACRMAVALGMHRESVSDAFEPVERELRRRVWCTLYMFEQDLCLILGRPSSIAEDEEVDTALPNEAMLDDGSAIPSQYLHYALRLTRISQKIRKALFESACIASTAQKGVISAHEGRELHEGVEPTTSKKLLALLDEWQNDLPAHLTLDHWKPGSTFFRSAHVLHLQFNLCKQVLTRSYILQHVQSQLNNDNITPPRNSDWTSRSYQEQCEVSLNSAIESASILERLRLSQQLDGIASQDIYYAYHCGIVLLISLLPDHQAGGHSQCVPGPSTERVRGAVDSIIRIMREPRLCKTMKLFSTVTLQLARIVGLQRNESITGNAVIEQQQPLIADIEYNQWQNPDFENYEASILLSDVWLNGFLAQPDQYPYQAPTYMPADMQPQMGPMTNTGQYPAFYNADASSAGAVVNTDGTPFPPFPPTGDSSMMDLTNVNPGSASNLPSQRLSWTRTMLN